MRFEYILIGESVTFSLSGDLDRQGDSVCPYCGRTASQAYQGKKQEYERRVAAGEDPGQVSFDVYSNYEREGWCDGCYDAGGDRERQEERQLNVANANAIHILRDLLGQDAEKDLSGSLDPEAVLRALSVPGDLGRHAEEPSEHQGVHISDQGIGPGATIMNMGRSEEQVNRYVEQLRAMAARALKMGEKIVYG